MKDSLRGGDTKASANHHQYQNGRGSGRPGWSPFHKLLPNIRSAVGTPVFHHRDVKKKEMGNESYVL